VAGKRIASMNNNFRGDHSICNAVVLVTVMELIARL